MLTQEKILPTIRLLTHQERYFTDIPLFNDRSQDEKKSFISWKEEKEIGLKEKEKTKIRTRYHMANHLNKDIAHLLMRFSVLIGTVYFQLLF